ncbi:MAG: hypothetical protein IJI22_05885 [Bacilli bacterium]|nr:hypothetical protein [Bacilli bacterium]
MKDLIEKLKEIRNSPKGGAIFFFGFYFFFFVLVFLLMNVGQRKPLLLKNYDDNKKNSFNVGYLTNKNYNFTYNIYLDNILYQYVGKQNGDKVLFDFNGKNYYVEDNNYYVYENGTWTNTDNPYVVDSSFFDVDKLVDLITLSSFEAKTEYESGKVVYNFLISSNTINQYMYNVDSDFLENPNKLIVSVENNSVNNIVFYLDSFCTLNNICRESLKIELDYNNYGEIEEINNPIG